MKKLFFAALIILVFISCDTLSRIPTNTSGGIFTLNGTWRLTLSSDNNAQVGTVVNVLPVVSNGTVTTLGNSNPYCYTTGTDIWRNIRGNGSGGFLVNSLVTACNGTSIYKDATIVSSGPNTISVSGSRADGSSLTQTWTRMMQN